MRVPDLRLDLRQLSPFGQRLVWVIASLTLAVLPHATRIPLWIVLLAAGAAALRLTIETRRRQLPPKAVRSTIAIAALLVVLFTYRTLNGVEAGTALLVVMAGMKLLESSSVRDLTVIVFLCYFSLFSALLYDQDLLQLPYLLLTAWLTTVTLMRIHQTTVTMPIREAAGITGRMLLLSLPLAVLLFLFFPRLPGQFWAMPARSQALSGLDDELSPGDVSELSLSSAIAFRVRFHGEMPAAKDRYWRGPVLHDFDGRTWRRSRGSFLGHTVTPQGATYHYRVTLEPHQRNWVFPLDMIVGKSSGPRAVRTPDFQLITRDPVATLSFFDLQSAPSYTMEGPLSASMRVADTLLPPERNPRSAALAKQLLASAGSPEAFIEAVLAKFRDEEYFYTLEPPRLARDSVDDFLFNTRRGFCEHFASAFTMMARAANIPARIVTGYQGGEYNPMGGYLVVRQSDAHAWSEVWLEGRGWVRVDPTAAVAPERVERGLDAAMSEEEPVPDRLLRRSTMLSQIRFAWDAANTFWNDQVVGFGESQQRWLLQRFDIDEAHWEYLGLALILTLVAFFAALTAYLGWRFRPRVRDPVADVYVQLCRKLARLDLPRLAHEGPTDYVTRVVRARPQLSAQLAEMRSLYVNLRYGPAPLASELSRLKFLVNQLKV
jgi:protein-glutamine gamma-glutamyltransferase